MSYTIRAEGSAQAELVAAVQWYEAQRPGLGAELLDEVQRTLDVVLKHPLIGGHLAYVSEALDVRRMPVRRFPYQIVYRLRSPEIQVIAFAHTRRKPGYWL